MTTFIIILHLAYVLEGEAGCIGPDAMLATADTVLARVVSPYFPDTIEDVLGAYYGSARPSEGALGIAMLAIFSPWRPGPYLFAYGQGDVRRLGWRPGERIICKQGYCQHFSRTFPEGK